MGDQDVQWLQRWFGSRCDGDWEHGRGITIQTLDNPGWSVQIELEGTDLEERAFDPIDHDAGDLDWMLCRIADGRFEGVGDPSKLARILGVFREWASRDCDP